mmetsp:Transcript_50113/g.119270  ORF Transcript_50113/g.119270 Transcript_50113/m.119270 type:complete len:313 (-) Transcript_50113:425-1363(-)
MQLNHIYLRGGSFLLHLLQGLVHEDTHNKRGSLTCLSESGTSLNKPLHHSGLLRVPIGKSWSNHNICALTKLSQYICNLACLLNRGLSLGLCKNHANKVCTCCNRALCILYLLYPTDLDNDSTWGHRENVLHCRTHHLQYGSPRVHSAHQGLADQDTAAPDRSTLFDIISRRQAAKGQDFDIGTTSKRNLEGLLQVLGDCSCPSLVQLEGVQVAVVDTKKLGPGIQRHLQLSQGYYLHQGLYAVRSATSNQGSETALRQNRHHQQSCICSMCGCFQNLVLIYQEVLAETSWTPFCVGFRPALRLYPHLLQIL